MLCYQITTSHAHHAVPCQLAAVLAAAAAFLHGKGNTSPPSRCCTGTHTLHPCRCCERGHTAVSMTQDHGPLTLIVATKRWVVVHLIIPNQCTACNRAQRVLTAFGRLLANPWCIVLVSNHALTHSKH